MDKRFLAALAIAATASPAFADDLAFGAAVAPTRGAVAGYGEVTISRSAGEDNASSLGDAKQSDEWTEVILGGSARLAIPVAPRLALQFDAWSRKRAVEGTSCNLSMSDCWSWADDTGYRTGGAVHLAYALDGASIGGLVSVGVSGDDSMQVTFATAALEGTVSFDSVRLYGQVGVTRGVSELVADNDPTPFAQGVLAYYIDPDLRISANAGISRATGDEGVWEEITLSWGARVEKKFEGTPFSLFAAYQGWGWESAGSVDDWQWNGGVHTVKIGARFAFGEGANTLRELDDTVGLRDMNHIYGDN